jgi:hypothetical protein
MACNLNDINNPIWAGLIGSAATWVVIGLGKRIHTILKFWSLKGEFHGESLNGDEHVSDKVYYLSYNVLKNQLKLKQNSQTKGNWESKIPISDWQPLIGMGNYKYTSGKYEGDWGIMHIRVNPEQKMLSIESQAMNSEAMTRFILRKKD